VFNPEIPFSFVFFVHFVVRKKESSRLCLSQSSQALKRRSEVKSKRRETRGRYAKFEKEIACNVKKGAVHE